MPELGDIVNIDCEECGKKTSHIYSLSLRSIKYGYVWKCILCKKKISVDRPN